MIMKKIVTICAATSVFAVVAADFKPYWQQEIIEEEPVAFYQNKRNVSVGTLMVEPLEIIKATNSDGTVIYKEGEDFTLDKESRKLTLTPNSKMIPLTQDDLYPEPNAPRSYGKKAGSDKFMFYSEDSYLPDRQMRVTYKPKAWDLPVPKTTYGKLTKLKEKITSKKLVEFAIFGDSISCGCNATSHINIPPFQPPQYERFARFLREIMPGGVTYHNFSVGGQTASWGKDNLGPLLSLKNSPDFVILAWGVNDASGGFSTEDYVYSLKEHMRIIKEKFPETEFILLTTMPANPAWQFAGTILYSGYSKAVQELATEGVLVVDSTPAWNDIFSRKRYMSLSSNGLNHPNDFGHKVYADIIFDAVNQSSLK